MIVLSSVSSGVPFLSASIFMVVVAAMTESNFPTFREPNVIESPSVKSSVTSIKTVLPSPEYIIVSDAIL